MVIIDIFFSVFGDIDKNRIAKSERNVGKGARAARVQRNKMVNILRILTFSFSSSRRCIFFPFFLGFIL